MDGLQNYLATCRPPQDLGRIAPSFIKPKFGRFRDVLRERKPDRRLDTNVEFYTALLLHGIGLPTELFTPTFAVGRVAGWSAHCLEQLRDGRLIRPQSVYIGPTDLHYDSAVVGV